MPEIKTVRLGSPDQILDELPQIAREADYVMADGPGSNTETSRTLLLCADLAIVPVQSQHAGGAGTQTSHLGAAARPQNPATASRRPSSCSAWLARTTG